MWAFEVDWIQSLRSETVAAAVAVVVAVAAAAVIVDIVASASCTGASAADCCPVLWGWVRSVGRTVTFQPLDSNSFDRRTVANRESGIFADLLIEVLAATRTRTTRW